MISQINEFNESDWNIPELDDYSLIKPLDSLNEKKQYIEQKINWTILIESLSVPEKHSPTMPFLDKNDAEELCLQYRRFLYLKCKYGDHIEFSPSVGMDIIWHSHILDTMTYHNDLPQ